MELFSFSDIRESFTGLYLRQRLRRIVRDHTGTALSLVGSYVPTLVLGERVLRDYLEHGLTWDTPVKFLSVYGAKFAIFYGASHLYYKVFPEHGQGVLAQKIREQLGEIRRQPFRGTYHVLAEDVAFGARLGYRVLGYMSNLSTDPVISLPREYRGTELAFADSPVRRVEFV